MAASIFALMINNLVIIQFLMLSACAGTKAKLNKMDLPDEQVVPLAEQLDSLVNSGVLSVKMIEDFEDSTFTDNGKRSGNEPSVISEGDNQFMRAQLSGKMKVGHRSEVSFGKYCMLHQDSLYVLYFKVRFRPDSAGSFPKGMFMQVHAAKSKAQKQDKNLNAWQSFVGRVEAGGNSGYWEGEKIWEKDKRSEFELTHGAWNEVLVLLRLSDDDTGIIKAYRNGVVEFEAEGPNSADWMNDQFLKLGVYSAHNSGRKAKYGPPSMAYRSTDFDDVRIYKVVNDQDIDSLLDL